MPPAADLEPGLERWPSGQPIFRIYHRRYGPRGFNPTSAEGRFRPVRTKRGKIVATAYCGEDEETALAEALLRGVDAIAAGRRRRLYLHEVEGLELIELRPTVDLELARFHGQGLTRLKLLREHVVDCDESRYAYTAEWAQAVYDCERRPFAGIGWVSRQNDSAKAMVLWATRLHANQLKPAGRATALDDEPGIDLVRQACAYAKIDFEG